MIFQLNFSGDLRLKENCVLCTYLSLYFFRFIDLVTNSNSEKRLIQDCVKRLRKKYLLKNVNLQCESKMIPLSFISSHFERLSKMVGYKSSHEINRNLSRTDINSAAEMFIALNSCPSSYVKLYWKLIYGNESKITRFAANIIRKAKDDFKVRAQKIFAKISSMLGFKYITFNHHGGSISKIILDVEGKDLLL